MRPPPAVGAEPATVEEVDRELASLRPLLATVSKLSKPLLIDQLDGLLDRRLKLVEAASDAGSAA